MQIVFLAIGFVAGGMKGGVAGNWPTLPNLADVPEMTKSEMDDLLEECEAALSTASWPT